MIKLLVDSITQTSSVKLICIHISHITTFKEQVANVKAH